ncbi:type IVB secretion system protein IcmV [Legionella geestiana]|nr:type IVB secretion system protein IcmV [Legionella geestiana]QBS12566.1 type IV secretion protein IcmV [Legionella geestiana]
MKKQSRTRRIVGRIGGAMRGWLDFDRMKSITLYLGQVFARLFIPQKKQEGEGFEATVARLGLTESDLDTRRKSLYRLSLFMVALAMLIFIYSVYHFVYGSYTAACLSLVIMLVALALAFRYHFWYFQIRERKLGCTLGEWYREGLRGQKP